jgi:hypothetical protein
MSPVSRNFLQIIYGHDWKLLFCVRQLELKLETEKLDKIYLCEQCRSVFLFKSDVEDHIEMSGQSDTKARPFK